MRRFGAIAAALLLCSAPAWAVATVEKTVGGSTPDYATLALFEAANTDLVTANAIWKAVCRNFEDTAAVTFAGWTTSATQYVWITADPTTLTEANRGVWSTDKYRLVVNGGMTMTIGDVDMVLSDLQISNANAFGNNSALAIAGSARADEVVLVERCILRYAAVNMAARNGSLVSVNSAGTYVIRNTLLQSLATSTGTLRGVLGLTSATLQNVTVVGFGGTTHVGIERTAGTLTATNTITSGCTDGFSGTIAGTYNSSSVADDVPNADASNHHTVTFLFVDAAGGDYHLTALDPERANGSDLSAQFADDVDTDTRPTGANTWSRGFDQVPAPALHFPALFLLTGW